MIMPTTSLKVLSCWTWLEINRPSCDQQIGKMDLAPGAAVTLDRLG